MRRLLMVLPLLVSVAASLLWQRAERRADEALRRVVQLERAHGVVASSPSPAASSPEMPTSGPAPGERVIRVPAGVAPEQYVRVVDNKAIEELTGTVAELRQQLAAATEETQKLTAAASARAQEQNNLSVQIAELRESLRAAKNSAAGFQAELQTKTDRAAAAEAGQKALSERLARAEAAATKAASVSREVEDLNRRREAQLATLQRRYLEANDIYRAFLLNEQNREHSTTGNQAGDISRIQNSIQQAEDDLRQIQILNARIATLTR